ncbi:DUF1120 domain-containing protein [Burkholderia sp. Ac-20353]|uniref:DUF1120 domain-containing protein n=1 Tax=Burkholderia sp. Ac-20353 TaxID=2703894 RepID=UPI00197C4BB0|nr:DUF1120 domain-containing protein [Burkholderia sp. Ac-20353]MBN3788034.1 DUF1120 domain-containing protein [Burkholderia sp. Ac-20353]
MSLQKLLVLSALVCSLSIPSVTSAADLSVNGHIRAHGACSITLGNGGIIDFGNLSRTDIVANSSTHFEVDENMPLTINCQQPTKVGVNLIDNREGTVPDGHTGFGLGNPLIGSYRVGSHTTWGPLADGGRVETIERREGSTTWRHPYVWSIEGRPQGMVRWTGRDYTTSWGTRTPVEPVAFKKLTDVLWFGLSFVHDMAFTDELEIDGSLTLDFVYL